MEYQELVVDENYEWIKNNLIQYYSQDNEYNEPLIAWKFRSETGNVFHSRYYSVNREPIEIAKDHFIIDVIELLSKMKKTS